MNVVAEIFPIILSVVAVMYFVCMTLGKMVLIYREKSVNHTLQQALDKIELTDEEKVRACLLDFNDL